jgi:tetratricopeptide (TPR) repeat protein
MDAMQFRWLGRFVLALALCLGGAARGDDGDALARQRFAEGRRLYAAGRFTDALIAFEAGRAASPRPEFDYNIGFCLEKLQRGAEAADAYERFVRARPDDAEVPLLRHKIARLRPPAPAFAPVPAPAPAVAAVPPDAAPPARRFAATPRGLASLTLLGTSAALLVSGAATGGVALSDRGSYDNGCSSRACDPALYDNAHRLAIATDVIVALGATAAATSLMLYLTRPRHPERVVSVR